MIAVNNDINKLYGSYAGQCTYATAKSDASFNYSYVKSAILTDNPWKTNNTTYSKIICSYKSGLELEHKSAGFFLSVPDGDVLECLVRAVDWDSMIDMGTASIINDHILSDIEANGTIYAYSTNATVGGKYNSYLMLTYVPNDENSVVSINESGYALTGYTS